MVYGSEMHDTVNNLLEMLGLKLTPRIPTSLVNQVNLNPELLTALVSSTSFLYLTANTKTRLVVIRDNITTQPTCGTCDLPVHITTSGRRSYTFPTFCSRKCASSNTNTRAKVKATVVDRYGVTNPFKSPEIQSKIQSTLISTYGVSSPLKSDTIRKKYKNTMVDRYGVDNPARSDALIKKRISTTSNKYGVDNVFSSLVIQQQIKDTNILKYGSQYPNQQNLPQSTIVLLSDKTWLYEQHYTNKKTLSEISTELNCNSTTVARHLHAFELSTQNHYQSVGENAIASVVVDCGVDVIRGDRTVIAPYELDIYIPSHNIAIEYCGLYWHSEQQGKDRHYHKRKTDMCAALGIQLLTIFEDEWIEHQTQVTRKIQYLVGSSSEKRVFARMTNTTQVDKKTKKCFFNENHIQGDGHSSINVGLLSGKDLVACMGFISNKQGYYLSRYATSGIIVGGFSKLMAYFIKNNNDGDITTFADRRWSTGALYEDNGWVLDSVLQPDYSYSPDGYTRKHKFNYRRKNLPMLLGDFNPLMSERQNCDANGVLRVWDCGKYKYKYIK